MNGIADFGKNMDERVEIVSGIDGNPTALATRITKTDYLDGEPTGLPDSLREGIGFDHAKYKIRN